MEKLQWEYFYDHTKNPNLVLTLLKYVKSFSVFALFSNLSDGGCFWWIIKQLNYFFNFMRCEAASTYPPAVLSSGLIHFVRLNFINSSSEWRDKTSAKNKSNSGSLQFLFWFFFHKKAEILSCDNEINYQLYNRNTVISFQAETELGSFNVGLRIDLVCCDLI